MSFFIAFSRKYDKIEGEISRIPVVQKPVLFQTRLKNSPVQRWTGERFLHAGKKRFLTEFPVGALYVQEADLLKIIGAQRPPVGVI